MTPEELKQLKGGGRNGFFSYAMNIDLKRGTVNSYLPYPRMPKATDLPQTPPRRVWGNGHVFQLVGRGWEIRTTR
ncbi:MAG: hypothetical protein CM1200mP29_11910 [Verrucomicrobiota bacterium]|nr:MAG: hypothetical protein CM1200mP29_11910 [Verrucomicrobiota bacterium]